jgi:hypothetical protein
VSKECDGGHVFLSGFQAWIKRGALSWGAANFGMLHFGGGGRQVFWIADFARGVIGSYGSGHVVAPFQGAEFFQ